MKNNYIKSLSCAIALMTICTAAANAYDFTDGKIYYDRTSESTCEVTFQSEIDKYVGDIVIPSTVTNNGVKYAVTGIGEDAFNNCHELNSIVIPDGVTTIGYCAMGGCSNLTSVTLPSGITNLAGELFWQTLNLKSVIIPDNVTSIGLLAFSESGIETIIIPDKVESIALCAFIDCPELTAVTIGKSVSSFGGGAFFDCPKL